MKSKLFSDVELKDSLLQKTPFYGLIVAIIRAVALCNFRRKRHTTNQSSFTNDSTHKAFLVTYKNREMIQPECDSSQPQIHKTTRKFRLDGYSRLKSLMEREIDCLN